MSFSSHPFKDFDIGQDENGYYHWICDSCGGSSKVFSSGTEIVVIHLDYIQHVTNSHRMTREQVQNWTSRI